MTNIGFNVKTNIDGFLNDFCETVRSFSPILSVDNNGMELFIECIQDEHNLYAKIMLDCKEVLSNSRVREYSPSKLIENRNFKRFCKITLYRYLSAFTGIELPYGSLTGIRPTKLYYDLINEGVDPKEVLSDYYLVSKPKLELISNIIETQKGIYSLGEGEYNAFANIPVCPTRCAYCSFLADTVKHSAKFLPDYADNVARDISEQFDMNLGKRRAIYVGGGTPTSISDEQLDKILRAFRAKGEEFTVEAGRPETLTAEKIAIMKANGVTRVSVNPQTFKESTLKLIGRAHTLTDIYSSYELARKGGFDINMDLIAMLPDESVDDFAMSVNKAIELRPENITVHTLSIKRGSVFNLEGKVSALDSSGGEMVEYAYRALTQAGYRPYYMYRQKNTFGRLENVGYCLPDKACVYNVDIMEETHTIHASGAGAISKKVFRNSTNGDVRIERLSEIKEIKGYNEQIDTLIQKKRAFFMNKD